MNLSIFFESINIPTKFDVWTKGIPHRCGMNIEVIYIIWEGVFFIINNSFSAYQEKCTQAARIGLG